MATVAVVIHDRLDLDARETQSLSPGTIAILNQGEVNESLSAWLFQIARRWPHLPSPVRPQGNQIARQRNMAVEQMVGDWVFFLDADAVPPRTDVLLDLVSSGAGIVSGVALERWPPFHVGATSLETGEKLLLKDLPVSGPLEVATVGTGCLLIRREVFTAMDPPWFRCGQIDPQYLTEDTEFCFRAAKAGFRIVLHCGVRIGHLATGVLWPGRNGQRWIEWRGPVDVRESVDEIESRR